MTKLRRLLPFILAVILLTVSYVGIGLASRLLPDYRGEVEAIGLSPDSGMLILESGDDTLLWPWTLYERRTPGRSVSFNDSADDRDAFVRQAIASLSPYVVLDGEESPVDLSYIEWVYDEDYIYFIHDAAFTDAKGQEFILNMAFSSYFFYYYSCVPADTGEVSYDTINKAYESLQLDYQRYIEPVDADSEVMAEVDSDYEPDNAFFQLEDRVQTYPEFALGGGGYGIDIPMDIYYLRGLSGTAEIRYTPRASDSADRGRAQLRLNLRDEDASLSVTFFYDPELMTITGFSYVFPLNADVG